MEVLDTGVYNFYEEILIANLETLPLKILKYLAAMKKHRFHNLKIGLCEGKHVPYSIYLKLEMNVVQACCWK